MKYIRIENRYERNIIKKYITKYYEQNRLNDVSLEKLLGTFNCYWNFKVQPNNSKIAYLHLTDNREFLIRLPIADIQSFIKKHYKEMDYGTDYENYSIFTIQTFINPIDTKSKYKTQDSVHIICDNLNRIFRNV